VPTKKEATHRKNEEEILQWIKLFVLPTIFPLFCPGQQKYARKTSFTSYLLVSVHSHHRKQKAETGE